MQAPRSPRPFAGTFLLVLYIVGSRTIPARTRREAQRASPHRAYGETTGPSRSAHRARSSPLQAAHTADYFLNDLRGVHGHEHPGAACACVPRDVVACRLCSGGGASLRRGQMLWLMRQRRGIGRVRRWELFVLHQQLRATAFDQRTSVHLPGCQLPQRPEPQLRWSLPRPGLQGPGGVLWRSGPL